MQGEEAKAPEVAADVTADIAAWQRHGDEQAARRLMTALYPSVMSIIRERLPRRSAEEDLAQEVFVRFFEKLASYDGRAPLAHWLSRIAVNICLDALRADVRRRVAESIGRANTAIARDLTPEQRRLFWQHLRERTKRVAN